MGIIIDVQNPKSFEEWCKCIGAIPKDKYEQRLRADMVGMLMDLYLLFEDCQTVEECFGILNKRIADLKGEAQE